MSPISIQKKTHFMRLALQEAHKALGQTSPNPPVGCVIVGADKKILATGYHQAAGQPHAEIEALQAVQNPDDLKTATLFVTLEPCAHQGRTPSCAKALAQSPVPHIVYGLQDPNPLVAGRGHKILAAAGKVVEPHPPTKHTSAAKHTSATKYTAAAKHTEDARTQGLTPDTQKEKNHETTAELDELTTELNELVEVFFCNMKKQKTFIALKMATSLDGQMALRDGASKWITGLQARQHAHYLRSIYDAVLVGVNTIFADNPQLNVRQAQTHNKNKKLIILDPDLRLLTGAPNQNQIKKSQNHSQGQKSPNQIQQHSTARSLDDKGQQNSRISFDKLTSGAIKTQLQGYNFFQHFKGENLLVVVRPKVYDDFFLATQAAAQESKASAQESKASAQETDQETDQETAQGAIQKAPQETAQATAPESSLTLIPCPVKHGAFDLQVLLKDLYGRGVCSVLVEGGATTHRQFIRQQQFERVYQFMAPIILGGGQGRLWTQDLRVTHMDTALRLKNIKTQDFGPDLLWTGSR